MAKRWCETPFTVTSAGMVPNGRVLIEELVLEEAKLNVTQFDKRILKAQE